MTYTEIALKYCHDVIDGKIPACRLVKLACKRHLDDLERSKDANWPYRYDEKKAHKRCSFSEKFQHVKGRWAGSRLKLEPWQVFIECSLWGWIRKSDKMRRFRVSYVEIPRKNGKSVTAAVAGNYMLTADGEKGAEIYSGASTEKQAMEVFRPAWQMANGSDDFRSHFGVSLSGTPKNPTSIYRLQDMSRFEPLVGNPGDGASPHCAIIDEYHEHRSSDQYDTMETGMGAREQPLMFVITTAGSNTSGPCYEMHLRAIKILEHTIEDEAFFALIYTVDNQGQTLTCKPSIEALLKLEANCTCGHAQTIQRRMLLQEDYANSAITENRKELLHFGSQKGQGEKKKDAEIIPGGSLKQTVFVPHAVKESFLIKTRKKEKLQIEGVASGQKTTQIESGKQSKNSLQKPDIRNANEMRQESTFMESPRRNTKTFAKNSEIGALFAKETIENFVLITATRRGLLGEFCAGNAIQPLDCLEILKLVCEEHSITCKVKQNKIEIIDNAITIFTPPDDWKDFEVWKKANPNYGISIMPDYLERKHRETMTNASKQNVNLCKHLNVWTNAGTAWMNMVKWSACEDRTLKIEDFKGQPCYVSVDLATKIDICAVRILFEGESRKVKRITVNEETGEETEKELIQSDFVVFGKYYLPEETVNLAGNEHYVKWVKEGWITETPGARTDYYYIEEDLKAIHAAHPIIELTFDPKEATYLVNNIMQWLGPEKCIEMNQGPALMSEPMKELEARIYDRTILHNGDPVQTWMMGNVIKKQGRTSGPVKYYYPTKATDKDKIDGPVCDIMNVARAMQRQAETSVYEGMTVEEIKLRLTGG